MLASPRSRICGAVGVHDNEVAPFQLKRVYLIAGLRAEG